MIVKHHITLDTSKTECQIVLTAKKSENKSRTVIVNFIDGKNQLKIDDSMQVTLRGKKPDGTVIYNSMVVNENGEVEYTFLTEDCSCIGIVEYEVEIISGESILYTSNFNLLVEDNKKIDDEVESSSSFTALQEARMSIDNKLAELQEKDVSLGDNLAKAKVELEKIADSTEDKLNEVTSQATELNEAISMIEHNGVNELDPGKLLINTFVSSSTGVVSNVGTMAKYFITYENLEVEALTTYVIQKKTIDRLAVNIAYYTSEKVFISGETLSTTLDTFLTFTTPENAAYLTISVRTCTDNVTYDLTDLMMSKGDTFKKYEQYYHVIARYIEKAVKSIIEEYKSEISDTSINQLDPKYLIERIGASGDTGVLSGMYDTYNAYVMLPIKALTTYVLQRATTEDMFNVIIAYYDENKEHIGKDGWSVATGCRSAKFTTPENANYITLSYKYTDGLSVFDWSEMMLSESDIVQDYVPYMEAKESYVKNAINKIIEGIKGQLLNSNSEEKLIQATNYESFGITDVRNLEPNTIYGFSRNITSDMVANLPIEKRYHTIIKLTPEGKDTYATYIATVYEFTQKTTDFYVAYDIKGSNDDTSANEMIWYKLASDKLDMNKSSFSAFRKWAVIGDSLSVGYIWNSDENAKYDRNLEYSWVQILARKYGNEAVNLGFSGADTQDWFTNSYGYAEMIKEENLAQAYIIGLGVNDVISDAFPIGTLDDIDLSNSANNAVSFIGQYARIIQSVKALNPAAKIFLLTMPSHGGDSKADKNEAIRTIAAYEGVNENCYLVDIADTYYEYFKSKLVSGYLLGGHYTPAGYANIATINGAVISDVIDNNAADFWNISFIPYSE